MATTVVNKNNTRFAPWQVYIGRKTTSTHYGNPFSHHEQTSIATIRVATREDAIRQFMYWLQGQAWPEVEPVRRRWILEHVHELRDHELTCFCKPQACHGDLLAQLADGVPLDQLRLG